MRWCCTIDIDDERSALRQSRWCHTSCGAEICIAMCDSICHKVSLLGCSQNSSFFEKVRARSSSEGMCWFEFSKRNLIVFYGAVCCVFTSCRHWILRKQVGRDFAQDIAEHFKAMWFQRIIKSNMTMDPVSMQNLLALISNDILSHCRLKHCDRLSCAYNPQAR